MDAEFATVIQNLHSKNSSLWKPVCILLQQLYHAGKSSDWIDTLIAQRPELSFGKRLCQIGTHAKDLDTRQQAMNALGLMAVHHGTSKAFKEIAAHPGWVKPLTEKFLSLMQGGLPLPDKELSLVAQTFFMLSGFGLSVPAEDREWLKEFYPHAAAALERTPVTELTGEALHFIGKSTKDESFARTAIATGMFPSIIKVGIADAKQHLVVAVLTWVQQLLWQKLRQPESFLRM